MSAARQRPAQVVQDDGRGILLEKQAIAELRRSAYPGVRGVVCTYGDGILTLTGRVPTYFQKQIAQCAVLQCLRGLATVNNQVQVGPWAG